MRRNELEKEKGCDSLRCLCCQPKLRPCAHALPQHCLDPKKSLKTGKRTLTVASHEETKALLIKSAFPLSMWTDAAADMQVSPAWYPKINLFQADSSRMRLVDRQLGYLVGSIVAAWGFWCEGCGWEAALQPTGCDVGSKLETLTSLWTEAESPRAAWRTAAAARPQVAALNPACRSKQETQREWLPGADDDTAGGILEVIRNCLFKVQK